MKPKTRNLLLFNLGIFLLTAMIMLWWRPSILGAAAVICIIVAVSNYLLKYTE